MKLTTLQFAGVIILIGVVVLGLVIFGKSSQHGWNCSVTNHFVHQQESGQTVMVGDLININRFPEVITHSVGESNLFTLLRYTCGVNEYEFIGYTPWQEGKESVMRSIIFAHRKISLRKDGLVAEVIWEISDDDLFADYAYSLGRTRLKMDDN